MPKAFAFFVCALLVLSGCSTPSQRAKEKRLPPDWEAADLIEPAPVTNAPILPPALTPPLQTNYVRETWISFERWSQMNCLGIPRRISLDPAPTYALTMSNAVMVIRAGSRSAYWNGLEFQLGFAPQLIDNQPFVHALDTQKNFLPLLHEPLEIVKTNRVIVIDPGHGGVDTGARNVFNGRHEKEFNLDWASRLAALLATNGWTVFLTRTNDRDLSLAARVAFAEEHRADLFLSLHFNSASPGNQSGLETYCLTPMGMPSNLTRGFGDDTSQSFPNNAFDAQNLQLAVRLHGAMLEVNGKVDRGVRRARFLGVLRGQNRPAVLLEGGYLSNPHEARSIADPEYRQKLAEAVARALGARIEDGG